MAREDQIDAWRRRAKENMAVAISLAGDHPPRIYAAVSRLYYGVFQSVCWLLLAKNLATPSHNHGEVWRAADSLRSGLCGQLQDLHSWRRKADYASGEVPLKTVQGLVVQFSQLTQELCKT